MPADREDKGSFRVVFEGNSDVFKAGQLLRGHVEVQLVKDLQCKCVSILLKGKAKVQFRGKLPNHRRVYTGKEHYLETEMRLWGLDPSSRDSESHWPVLSAGNYTFPFEFQLPTALPTSAEGTFGHVRYCAIATVVKPSHAATSCRAFTVLDMIDLYRLPNAMNPSSAQLTKKVGVWPLKSGKIEVHVQTDRSVYCPGETIRLSGTLKNNSRLDITETSVQLIQMWTFFATHWSYYGNDLMKIEGPEAERSREYLRKVSCAGPKASQTANLDSITYQVPPTPPSGMRHCSLITVEYKLKFRIVLPTPHSSLSVSLPVLIGSVPQGASPAAPPEYDPPPSYYEVVTSGETTVEDDEDNSDRVADGAAGNMADFAPKDACFQDNA